MGLHWTYTATMCSRVAWNTVKAWQWWQCGSCPKKHTAISAYQWQARALRLVKSNFLVADASSSVGADGIQRPRRCQNTNSAALTQSVPGPLFKMFKTNMLQYNFVKLNAVHLTHFCRIQTPSFDMVSAGYPGGLWSPIERWKMKDVSQQPDATLIA
jgi:hypothetical protein